MLTTITPYWGRSETLSYWIKSLHKAHHNDVQHLLLFCGEAIPEDFGEANIRAVACGIGKGVRPSIGYFHNVGAQLATTEWIMKLDVDAFPNANYFKELVPVLEKARDREWFNGGMFYINKESSHNYLRKDPLSESSYQDVIRRLLITTGQNYRHPAATNFICRRADYISLGGCDKRFQGWGWEDYQQIYMLERHQRNEDPLLGPLTLDNATLRCRDEISRPKAAQLYQKNGALALLHHWHPPSTDRRYRDPQIIGLNRQVLMDYISKARQPRRT